MFLYVNDINGHTWSINVNKVIKVTESQKTTLIYLDDGVILSTRESMLELVARLNNV
jgi:hypothetical protein